MSQTEQGRGPLRGAPQTTQAHNYASREELQAAAEEGAAGIADPNTQTERRRQETRARNAEVPTARVLQEVQRIVKLNEVAASPEARAAAQLIRDKVLEGPAEPQLTTS